MVRKRVAVIGLVLVLLAGTVTVASAPSPAGAVPAGVVPTQWVAQQFTELLGRAPTQAEWAFGLAFYQGEASCTTENLLALTKLLTGPGTEFAGLYPAVTPLDKATRLAAVARAVMAHDPNDADWAAYFVPYLRDSSAPDVAWAKAVNFLGAWAIALSGGPGSICNPATPSRGFAFMRPIDLRAKVKAEFPAQNLVVSRTQAQLQQQLNTAASGATPAARTVSLRQGEVVRVGGATGNNQGLEIPAGVTLTTENTPAYTEPGIGSAPKALAYARMGRVVAYTSPSTTYPQPADGRTCTLWFCQNTGMVRLGIGSKLSGVWVDGQGTGDTNSKIALVETAGSTAANPTSVTASRLSEPGRDGAALRLHGNSAGTPCTNEKITGNLITAYSSVSQFDQSGQAQWADGIIVSCEHALVSSNSIVDVTDTAILVLGSFNRAQNKTVTQRSQVYNNAILSAGNDTHVALGADAVGICRADRDGFLIACIDQFVPRDMTGSAIHNNTFWTGPRTSIDIGLMVGGGALWGDHKIPNASPATGQPSAKGTTFDRNTTGINGARLNIGIDISDMVNAKVTANTLTTTLVDGNPRLTWGKCPQVRVAVGPQERATTTTDLTLPAATTTTRGCLIGEPPASGPERIRIKTDGTGFEGTNTKRPFHVWGGDLPYLTPLATVVDDLRDVRRMGANTVRLLIDLEDIIKAPTTAGGQPTVDQAALNKLNNIATAAAQTGIYLDITGIGIERHHSLENSTFTSWYDSLGAGLPAETKRWDAQKLFWSTVANKLKNQNSILLYDLVNEPTFGASAGKPAPNWCFGTYGGYCYNQNPVKTLAHPGNPTRTAEQVVNSWLSGMRAAIRQHDPTRPISVGIIAGIGSGVGCPGVFGKNSLAPHVDLMMPHFYPEAASVDTNVRQAKECKLAQKPLIVEETYNWPDPVVLEKFVAGTSSVSSGYLGHFIGGTPSQLAARISVETDDTVRVHLNVHLGWDTFFLRNGYTQSPAGQGIMPY